MQKIKLYFVGISVLILCVLIAKIFIYVIKSERKIKELEEGKIMFEITKQTLENNIKEQQKIINNIYKKNQQQERIIEQNADKFRILDVDTNTDDKIKQEIFSFNLI